MCAAAALPLQGFGIFGALWWTVSTKMPLFPTFETPALPHELDSFLSHKSVDVHSIGVSFMLGNMKVFFGVSFSVQDSFLSPIVIGAFSSFCGM